MPPDNQIATAPSALAHHLSKAIDGAQLAQTQLPQCPDISLWLLDKGFPQWLLSNEQAAALMEKPPFWSFCWASGQALAKYILANPELVKGRTLVDLGAGSGVVAIAAKMAGASSCIACDSDPVARLACEANALLNGVVLETYPQFDDSLTADIIVVADVFYDRDNLPLLQQMRNRFATLLVADSRLKGQPLEGLSVQGSYSSHTVPDLDESSEFNTVYLYTRGL